ncbi:MAG: choice-of-anchor Q domain-containing protein, partial [Bacteroidia bacterium]
MAQSSVSVTLTDTDTDNIVSNSNVVTITATFSESMAATPTLSLTGIVSEAPMTATASNSIWTYTWTVSTTQVTSTTATVSGTDLSGIPYYGNDSLTFTIDTTPPNIIDVARISNEKLLVTFDEDVYPTETASGSLTASNFKLTLTSRTATLTSQTPSSIVASPTSSLKQYVLTYQISGTIVYGDTIKVEPSQTVSVSAILDTVEKLSISIDAFTSFTQGNDRINVPKSFHEIKNQSDLNNTIKVIFLDVFEGNILYRSQDSNYYYFEADINSTDITNSNYYSTYVRNDQSTYYFKARFEAEEINPIYDYAGNLAFSTSTSNTVSLEDATAPMVTLSNTDADNIVTNTNVVTITATFSKSMSATPTLSLTGIISDAQMSATASDSIWTYTWTASGTTVTSTTATVSGTDLSGNAYTGTDSITFIIYAQTHNFSNTDDGWSSVTDNGILSVGSEFLKVSWSNGATDPKISNTKAGFDGSVNKYITLKIKNSSSNGPETMRFIFPKEGGGNKFYNISITNSDTEFKSYYLDLSNDADWNGIENIIDLQFKGINNTNYTAIGNFDIEIDMISASSNNPTLLTEIFISTNGDDNNSGNSIENAVKSFSKALTLAAQGATIYFMDGTFSNDEYKGDLYDQATYARDIENIAQDVRDHWFLSQNSTTVLIDDIHGTKDNYYTIKPYNEGGVTLKNDGLAAILVKNSSYIKIEGFNIIGELDNIPLETALHQQFLYKDLDTNEFKYRIPPNTPTLEVEGMTLPVLDNIDRPTIFNTAGITVNKSHHIEISNNTVSNMPGEGIRSFESDFLHIRNNKVFKNSLRSSTGVHGLSLYLLNSSVDLDNINFEGYRTIIENNEVYSNDNEVYSWNHTKPFVTPHIDEGKGITIQRCDVERGWEKGRVLIRNNVSYRNGLSGIHINVGDRIDIINNTVYNNFVSTEKFSEGSQHGISTQGSDDINIINNIVISEKFENIGGRVLKLSDACTNITINKNLLIGTLDDNSNQINTNSVFEVPNFNDPTAENFELLSNSPAIDSGDQNWKNFVQRDFNNNIRNDSSIDIGAFEYFNSRINLTLTDTDSDNIVSNSDVVTITATFSESMSATPTLSLTGIVSDAEMTATASDSIWTYTWRVSTSVASTTATVSGTDLSGNAYTGIESLTYTIDNTPLTVLLDSTDSDQVVSNSDVVTITATFSKVLSNAPTISLSGIVSDVTMSNGKSIVLRSNNGWQSSSGSFQNFSGTAGSNPYLGENKLVFSYIDNAYVWKTFDVFSGASSILINVGYQKSFSEDTGKVIVEFYDSSNTLISSNESGILTGTSSIQYLNLNSTVPSNAVKVSVRLKQLNEGEFWSGNYGIQFKDFEIYGVEGATVNSNPFQWYYTWTVSSSLSSTTATVSAVDQVGNLYSGTASLTFTMDNSSPNLTITKPEGNYTNQSVVVTLTYDEAITGLTTDTSLFSEATNVASLTLLSVSNDYKVYGVLITPRAEGTVKLTHAPGSPPVTDIAGNSIAATVSCSFVYDTTAPTVSLTDSDADNLVINSNQVTLTATFSEAMAATPTISLSEIVSEVPMTATS